MDLADAPEKRVFQDLIPHDEQAHLQDVLALNGDYAAVVYKRNVRAVMTAIFSGSSWSTSFQVKDEIYVYQLSTGKQLQRLAPDFVGAATITGRRKQSWFFSTLTGFTTPGLVAKYDFSVKEDKRWSIYRTTLVSGLNLDDFSAEQVRVSRSDSARTCVVIPKQVWYTSKDGTRVPMFVVRHKDTKFDGTAPALQFGAYHILPTPGWAE